MNTAANPNFAISAHFLGPVLSLDANISKSPQNLIFARNGTGKSFISRAFRCLDLYGQEKSIADAPSLLVSDEAKDGGGDFRFSRGQLEMGALELNRVSGEIVAKTDSAIFHVFSEDFVQDELRERSYIVDGEIDSFINIDSGNIEITEAKEYLTALRKEYGEKLRNCVFKFDSEKELILNHGLQIRKNLTEYGHLEFDECYREIVKKPTAPERTLSSIRAELDSLKSIPSDPVIPSDVNSLYLDGIDFSGLDYLLQKITSASTVADALKAKIDEHAEFYRNGAAIVQGQCLEECPFCEQEISAKKPKAVIDAYIAYFNDEESQHKSAIFEAYTALIAIIESIDGLERRVERQRGQFNKLRWYIPSQRNVDLNDCEEIFSMIREYLENLKAVVEGKLANLSQSSAVSNLEWIKLGGALNVNIDLNNDKARGLASIVEQSDGERRQLQRAACDAFKVEFFLEHWVDIEKLISLQREIDQAAARLESLEKSAPSANARKRVASTFEMLVESFFSGKYVFDKEKFTIMRGSHEMSRGVHRTLSDGEKTAIAFCYFIASVHKKIKTTSDYRRLFIVFDDPVTSMSYDYVFTIAQILKNLNISEGGEISITSGKYDGSTIWRPNLLILTHSSYFFNISVANKVIGARAAFSLNVLSGSHKIVSLSKYIAPFEEQLRDVFNISQGGEPDHRSANAIRSVLEAIGRFCVPDKAENLSEFVQYLAGVEGIPVRSVLINSLSHGTYYEDVVSPDDLKVACEDTIAVVERFAPGQLELIKKTRSQD